MIITGRITADIKNCIIHYNFYLVLFDNSTQILHGTLKTENITCFDFTYFFVVKRSVLSMNQDFHQIAFQKLRRGLPPGGFLAFDYFEFNILGTYIWHL